MTIVPASKAPRRAEVHDGELLPERVAEAALRHAPVQRHLAALEPALAREAVAALLPFSPRPAVLPSPLPGPRPTRLRVRTLPFAGLRL